MKLVNNIKREMESYYNKNKTCPTDNNALGIKAPDKWENYRIDSITVKGCQIITKLHDKNTVPTELQGKSINLIMQPNDNKITWTCTTDSNKLLIPPYCGSK